VPTEIKSWVEGANESHGFGLNHLPYGAFRTCDKNYIPFTEPHLCVRIGEWVLDLAACSQDALFDSLSPQLRSACCQSTLNTLLALGPAAWQSLRQHLIVLLGEAAPGDVRTRIDWFLHLVSESHFVLPLAVGNYTDFYASLHHARRIGEIFRPDNPLLPNYKHIPIGYHGRASSIVISGTNIHRPWGQSRPISDGAPPNFAPSAALDYEVELAFIVGQGNNLGDAIPIAEARQHLFGVAILNDWSARDIQSWEYQPLGPFLGKSFATSLSPWITPLAALEPFRAPAQPRPAGDPQPLSYLLDETDQQSGALDIHINASLTTSTDAQPLQLSQTNTRELYWTPAQLVAHHTSNGCNLQSGDILATGTLSGLERNSAGCLMELTHNGAEPLKLPSGDQRAWLQNGDTITLTAFCERPDLPRIQLGSCIGSVLPAHPAERNPS
jgi:fumarylacetoacetase